MKEPLREALDSENRTSTNTGPKLEHLIEEWFSDDEENDTKTIKNPIKVEQKAPVVSNDDNRKVYPLFNRGVRPTPYPLPYKPSATQGKEKLSKWLRPIKCKDGKMQMILDAGQKRFGAKQCQTCGLVYVVAEPEDEKLHLEHHTTLNILRHNGWKDERIVGRFGGDRVIMVKPGDPSFHLKRAQAILDMVNSELGYNGEFTLAKGNKLFLYVTEKKIVGLLLSEEVREAYRVVPSTCDSKENPQLCRTNVPEKALIGVSRIWTQTKYRHKKFGTRLVDVMRMHVFYGKVVLSPEVAFSSPTEAGMAFAARYTKTAAFLVYD